VLLKFFLGAERTATTHTPTTTLFKLLTIVQGDKKLSHAARWNDTDKLRDGVIARATPEAIRLAARWKVDNEESTLEIKTAEMIECASYFTAASQRPAKQVKLDFFFM
jgi:hypothetical protein